MCEQCVSASFCFFLPHTRACVWGYCEHFQWKWVDLKGLLLVWDRPEGTLESPKEIQCQKLLIHVLLVHVQVYVCHVVVILSQTPRHGRWTPVVVTTTMSPVFSSTLARTSFSVSPASLCVWTTVIKFRVSQRPENHIHLYMWRRYMYVARTIMCEVLVAASIRLQYPHRSSELLQWLESS